MVLRKCKPGSQNSLVESSNKALRFCLASERSPYVGRQLAATGNGCTTRTPLCADNTEIPALRIRPRRGKLTVNPSSYSPANALPFKSCLVYPSCILGVLTNVAFCVCAFVRCVVRSVRPLTLNEARSSTTLSPAGNSPRTSNPPA